MCSVFWINNHKCSKYINILAVESWEEGVEKTNIRSDHVNSVEFKVGDMTCSNCVDVIRSSVGALKGVGNVKIDLDSKNVKVDFDDEVLQEQDIKSAIIEVGYSIM